jgi:uncharacterized protein (DUF305 family)
MPAMGLASPAEIASLRASSGRAADLLFAQLMLRHHEGGLPMMEAAAASAGSPQVRSLAQIMLFHQQQEIVYLTETLLARHAKPLPLSR